MSRTPDEAHRAQLLDRITAYVSKNGVADLSLRPLAQAVGSSPRVLLYHFGSKEDLIALALQRAGEEQRRLFSALRVKHAGSVEGCREIWKILSAPRSEPAFRLFFEVYGLALQDRRRFARFLKQAVAPWLRFIGDPLVEAGWAPTEAQAYATLVLGAFRGFLLDLCATRDRERIDRAVDLWLQTLSAAGAQRELAS